VDIMTLDRTIELLEKEIVEAENRSTTEEFVKA
jgi:hypothetical protein